MSASKKRFGAVFAAAAIICVLVCAIAVVSDRPPRDAKKLAAYIDRHAPELIALAKQYPNQYMDISRFSSLKSIDTRFDDVRYGFSWSYDVPEGQSFLYYAEDDMLHYDAWSFADSTRIDGLGINGQGYINCIRLRENWYFLECYLPT